MGRDNYDYDTCEICNQNPAKALPHPDFEGIRQDCPRCGEFKISFADGFSKSLISGNKNRARFSSYIRHQNMFGGIPTITSELVPQVLASPIPSDSERAKYLLLEAYRGQNKRNDQVMLEEPRFLAASYSENMDDVNHLERLLKEQKYLQSTAYGGRAEIMPAGFLYAEKLDNEIIESNINSVSKPLDEIVKDGEGVQVEFKSTLRKNLHTGKHDEDIKMECLRTIAAFMNSDGGVLIVGVNNDGIPLGIDNDDFTNEDKMHLHLVSLVKGNIKGQFTTNWKANFESYKDKRVFVVNCDVSNKPVFVKDGQDEVFYVRLGPSTQKLSGSELVDYIQKRFKK